MITARQRKEEFQGEAESYMSCEKRSYSQGNAGLTQPYLKSHSKKTSQQTEITISTYKVKKEQGLHKSVIVCEFHHASNV